MKQSFHDMQILKHEGQAFGLNIGWDFTAEHEFGLKSMKHALGVGNSNPRNFRTKLPRKWMRANAGVGMRLVTAPEEQIRNCVRFKDYARATKHLPAETRLAMLSKPFGSDLEDLMQRDGTGWGVPMARRDYRIEGNPLLPLSASWSSKGFVIRAFGREERDLLSDLHESLLRGDVALGLSGQKAFGGSGLTLAIASVIPHEIGDLILEQDLDEMRLQKAARATGIHKILKEAGAGYFALVPKWHGYFKDMRRSQHEVVFFLNPHDQKENSHGWFTVEELQQWVNGEGPVVRKSETTPEPAGPSGM